MPKEDFTEITTIFDTVEKIVQVPITVRETPDGNKYSFALMREFVRGGKSERTPFFFKRHIAGMRRMLDAVENWFEAKETEKRDKR